MRDDASAVLSRRAGELFATAGLRAFAALDFITTRDLLNRAALLLPPSDPQRLEMLPNLGVALTETGRPQETEMLLTDALERSLKAGLEREALRAKVQLLSNCVYRSPSDAEVSAAVAESEAAFTAFEAADDHVGCAEAAVALEYLEFMRGRVFQAHEWCHRALQHGLAAGRFRESAQAAADLVFMVTLGPVPFHRFPQIATEQVFPLGDPIAACAGHCLMAVAALAAGKEAEFTEHERRWRETTDLHGLGWLGAAQALLVADVETSAGHPKAAERRLREARNVLVSLGDVWWVSTLDSTLCKAIGAQADTQRFLRLADEFDLSPPVTDREILIRRNLVRAQAFLLRGSPADAEAAARAGIELAAPTDLVTDHADALLTLAAALDARGLTADAAKTQAEAETMLRAKGHMAAIATLSQRPT